MVSSAARRIKSSSAACTAIDDSEDDLIHENTLVQDTLADNTCSPVLPAQLPVQLARRMCTNSHQSNITLYEDVDDVFDYLEDKPSPIFANLPPSPPPRLYTSRSVMLKHKKRKNLAGHLGLSKLSTSTVDIASAQKIALENMQTNSASHSKKDLNRFLGLNDLSPVKLREKK